MKYIVLKEDPFPLLGVWILVIIIIAVIGLLNQSPPERPYQSFNEDNSKIQYITIGGATTTKVSTN
nr:MAG: hypothetical protein 3 [Betanecrovirus sp.]